MDQRGGAADGLAPIVELAAITVDCLDLRPMIDFYAQAFGARTSHEDDTGAWIHLDQGPLILLRRVDGYQTPTWPQQDVPIQFHPEFWIEPRATSSCSTRPATRSASAPACEAHLAEMTAASDQ